MQLRATKRQPPTGPVVTQGEANSCAARKGGRHRIQPGRVFRANDIRCEGKRQSLLDVFYRQEGRVR